MLRGCDGTVHRSAVVSLSERSCEVGRERSRDGRRVTPGVIMGCEWDRSAPGTTTASRSE